MPVARGLGSGTSRPLLTHRMLTFVLQRSHDVRWRYPAMPQDIDGAITWWRKASGAAGSHSLIMRPAMLPNGAVSPCLQAVERTLRIARQMITSFRCGKQRPLRVVFGLEARFGPCFARRSGQSEATLKGAMGKIVTLIIQVRATLFRIAQGCPQSCDPPSRNRFEGCCVHLVPPLNRFAYPAGAEMTRSQVPLNCCRVLPAIAVAAADR